MLQEELTCLKVMLTNIGFQKEILELSRSFFCKFVYTKGITGKEQALRDVILPIPVFDVCKRLSLSIQYDSS